MTHEQQVERERAAQDVLDALKSGPLTTRQLAERVMLITDAREAAIELRPILDWMEDRRRVARVQTFSENAPPVWIAAEGPV